MGERVSVCVVRVVCVYIACVRVLCICTLQSTFWVARPCCGWLAESTDSGWAEAGAGAGLRRLSLVGSSHGAAGVGRLSGTHRPPTVQRGDEGRDWAWNEAK